MSLTTSVGAVLRKESRDCILERDGVSPSLVGPPNCLPPGRRSLSPRPVVTAKVGGGRRDCGLGGGVTVGRPARVVDMKWLYWIPHTWDPPDTRMSWADVLLLPDDPAYDGAALWLTVDAVLNPAFDQDEWAGYGPERLQQMGDAEFHLIQDHLNLAVRAADFDRAECLTWVSKWLDHSFEFSGLAQASIENFAGRSQMADVITAIQATQHGK